MSSKSLTDSPEWNALLQHRQDIADVSIQDMFDQDGQRFEAFHQRLNGLCFDYSKHRLNKETLKLLADLAESRNLEGMRDKMLAGEAINASEGRAVLHCALRGSTDPSLEVDGENVKGFVDDTLAQIEAISAEIRDNPKITTVINIGIGGSDLGPRMVYKALAPFADGPRVLFVSNVDGRSLENRLDGVSPENTALIITSKTFTTLETLTNAQTAKDWFLQDLKEEDLGERFFAVSGNVEAAQAFGVPPAHILPMRDWVGGRFSLWSAVGLSTAVACGFSRFKELLAGGHAMDEHFKDAPLDENMPVIMGMIGLWYRNFWNMPAKAVLPYSHDLRDLPKYLQQLDMESNGKGVDINGHPLQVESGPIIFGEAGTNAQHAFMQLLHQSETVIPADFIVVAHSENAFPEHHIKLLSNALAQSQALMRGQSDTKNPQKHFEGNRPSSTIVLDRLDPYHLGMLIALYEHVIFVQGVIWGINSFDQWGVELGKVLAKPLFENFEKPESLDELDGSTRGLLELLQQKA